MEEIRIKFDLSLQEAELLKTILSSVEDRGPTGMGWKSPELTSLLEKIQKVMEGDPRIA